MNTLGRWIRLLLLVAGLAVAAMPPAARACAACFGASDSPLAKGMNMGIFALLGVVGLVLGGIAAFFVYLAKRAKNVNTAEQEALVEPWDLQAMAGTRETAESRPAQTEFIPSWRAKFMGAGGELP